MNTETDNSKDITIPSDVLTEGPDSQFECVKCPTMVSVPSFLYETAGKHGVMCESCCEKDAAEVLEKAIVSSKDVRAQQWNQICPGEYRGSDPKQLPKGHRLENMLAWEYGPQGFFLVGKTRAGKSRCAWMLAKREFMEGKSVRCLDYSSAFEYGSKFKDGVRDAHVWIEKHCACDLLILDDTFKAKLSDSFEQALFFVVARRTETQMPMIVTANDNFDTLKSRMTDDRGPAIVSRLKEFCQVLVFGL